VIVRPVRTLLLLAALVPGGVSTAAAQGLQPPSAAGEELSVFLLTMGTGDAVWEKYGHNAIWIHDPVRRTDWVFNYGVFDFDSPGYWGRFIRGDWLYQLAVADIGQTLAQYEYLNRTVVAQELDFTGAQKAELAAFLEWNYRPENREYLYDYFLDNCSTRIRDALDRVLDGRIRAATDSVPTNTTYRSHSRRLMAGDPVVYAGLHAGLGPAADRPISAWEEMFLPEKVHEQVRELRIEGDGGAPRPLVLSERVLYQAVGRASDREVPPTWIPGFLLIGASIAAALVLLARSAPRSPAARFAFAALGGVWSLLIGVGGLLLLGLWAFTNHTIADRNENVFQFVPLALPLVLLVPALAYRVGWSRRPARILAAAVAVVSVLGLLLQLLPGLDQVNGEIIALMLPVNVALGWAVWEIGFRS
jgi:hypothetical protein